MPAQGRRVVTGFAWVAASLLGWVIACYLLAFVVYLFFSELSYWGLKVPAWVVLVLIVAFLVGAIAIPILFAILAKRGKLPGTQFPDPQGFPVEVLRRENLATDPADDHSV
jgi:hypothetical protein